MSHGLATPPDRGTRLLLDVIVVARRDPHVAHILRRGLETYLEAMKVANDKGVALGAIDPALRTDELASFRSAHVRANRVRRTRRAATVG